MFVSESVERIDYDMLPIEDLWVLHDLELCRLRRAGVAAPAMEIMPPEGVTGFVPVVSHATRGGDLLGVEEVCPVDMNEVAHTLLVRQAGQLVVSLAAYLADSYSGDRRARGVLYLSGIYNMKQVVYGVPSVYGMPDEGEPADFFVRADSASLASSIFVPNPTRDINDLLTMAERLRLKSLVSDATVEDVGERLAKAKWC